MTGRDRMVIMVVVVVVALAAAYIELVSPERKQASKLASEVSTASSQLTGAESQLANARSAQTKYASAYEAIVNLGKAVPAGDEVPSLIYQLAQASNRKSVAFSSITSGSGAGSGNGTSAATPKAAASASFRPMPFTFVFEGSFLDLYHLLNTLDGFTQLTSSGGLQVTGRLLTVQSLKLSPGGTATSGGRLTGTITATAYVLPATQGLTGGATSASPAGAPTPAAAGGGGSGSPTAPAIARVTP
jgi:hypothetical protein